MMNIGRANYLNILWLACFSVKPNPFIFLYLFIGTEIFKPPQNVIDTNEIVLKSLTVEEMVVMAQFCTLFFLIKLFWTQFLFWNCSQLWRILTYFQYFPAS